MNDFAWIVRDSASAWLRGYGDGRFSGYETFYRKAWTADGAAFDLERVNEEYAQWIADRPSRLIELLNRPVVARGLIALVAVWAAGQAVPLLAGQAPVATGGLLVAAFVGLRVFHRQRKKRA